MLFIDKIPPQLQGLFDHAAAEVSKPQQYWLIMGTLAMAASMGKRNVSSLAQVLDPEYSRTAFNDFFINSPWPAPAALQSATRYVLSLMSLKPGERIEFILDGSQKAKRGNLMDALGYIKEAGSQEWKKGHRLLLGYLRVRGVMLPWVVDLYLSKKFLATRQGRDLKKRQAQIRFRTLNEMAADAVASLPKEWEGKYDVRVLMDSGFCNKTACEAVRARGFHYVVAAQRTRILVKSTSKGTKGKRVGLGKHAPGRLRYQGFNVVLPPKRPGGKTRRFRLSETAGTMRGLGDVKVVFSERRSDGCVLSLVSSDTGMDARDVALAYGWRWEIEVTIRSLKGCLGLGTYQCRYYEGMVHHLHLSLLAHLVIIAAELKRRGRRTIRKRAALQLPSIGMLQARFRQRVWRQLLERLRPACADRKLFARFERALGETG